MHIIHISLGGPDRTIQVNGKRHLFEAHPYCGPVAIKRNGDPLKKQPSDFWDAATRWYQQGQKIDGDGLCIWEHPAVEEPIVKHIEGRHYKVIAYKTTPARKGE